MKASLFDGRAARALVAAGFAALAILVRSADPKRAKAANSSPEASMSKSHEPAESDRDGVDLAKRAARIAVWPVYLRAVSLSPLTVEVSLTNTLDRTVSFDKPSVAFGGLLENDLFEVKADGRPVPYSGIMKKRAPADSFLNLKPGERYSANVVLSSSYAIPKGARTVEIRFAHHNHFSKDDFDLASRPLVVALDAP